MSTTIPCTIDTSPMAAELQSVSRHVNGTTTAVVTMQTAVIAAQKSGTDKVCSNVNRGFFTMMRSQISQKIAAKQARVESLLMKLAQQKRLLLNIKTTMEREYGRISERYLRLFTTINKDLEQRIYQLDQPVFELVNRQMQSSSNRMNALVAWINTSQSEGLCVSQHILASLVKHNAERALSQSTGFLEHVAKQKVISGKVLLDNGQLDRGERHYLPVILWETLSNESDRRCSQVEVSQYFSAQGLSAVTSAAMSSEDLPWHNASQEISPNAQDEWQKAVNSEFESLVNASGLSDRVKRLIVKMQEKNQYDTL